VYGRFVVARSGIVVARRHDRWAHGGAVVDLTSCSPTTPRACSVSDADGLAVDSPTEPVDDGRFALLAEPVFGRLITGGVFTFLAMQMSIIARSWLAYDLTGTNTALGGVLIGFGISSVVAIPYGGVLADRFPKRTVLLVAGGVQTTVALTLATAVVTDVIAYWMLVAASVVQGGMISLLGPARLAFVAEAVPRERMSNAILLSQASLQFTRVFGPAVAGALIGVSFVGSGGVFFIAAGFAAGGVVATLGLPPGNPSVAPTRSPSEDLLDGLRYVRSDPRVRHLLLLSFGVVLIGFPHLAFLPTLAEDVFDAGSTGFGLLTTSSAIGAVVATISLAGIAAGLLDRIQAAAGVAFGISIVLLGLAPGFATAVVVMFLVGATSAAFQALNNSLILSTAPVEYHGRVQSLLMLGFSGFGLAALPLGIVADAIGLQRTLTAMGIAVTAIAVASIFIERRRTRDRVRHL
jgi:MFS family permease